MTDENTGATSDENTASETHEVEEVTTEAKPEDKPLGPQGERALAAMKEERKELKNQLRDLKNAFEDLKASNAPKDEGPDHSALIADAEKKANDRIVRAEVKAAATGKLADPSDALTFLDLSAIEVDGDGEVDSKAISKKLDELLKNKPYLSAQGGKRFEGAVDQGARKATGPKQLTRDDLKKMKPREITAAKAAGQLKELLGE